ncbi:hypothetical protein O181_076971 [Austropuccinia psidii MF-1]|uniref:J domain-containing protein n=1 Tax=Austropuccinia psidii MF-1 TaxID=1389203 RepID=A0A9Q3FBF8_9BASI|nr:hypothetical protein [Austropuccinia psidii MF-1]
MTSIPIDIPFAIDFRITVGYVQPQIKKIDPLSSMEILPVGRAFQHRASQILNNRTLAEQENFIAEQLQSDKNNSLDEDHEVDDGAGDEPEDKDLLALDPRDWKNQDQYAVLGLSSLRWRATPDQIKRAHRKKVLRHHPDKKAGQAGNANDDSFFKCIAKAYEVLSDPVKRRQFDSIDEEVEDTVPTEKEVNASPEAFFMLYGPVFEREGRFSSKQPVPSLGDINSTHEQVENFYDFWLKFDSWRSFEWKDKDANEGSDSRTEKRHIENKNRSERERRKKEDNARRRNIVETALSLDPRMKKFKAEERLAREAKRKGPTASGTGSSTPVLSASEIQEKQAAELKAKEEVEKKAQQDKVVKEAAKKAKEAAKKNLKKEKKTIQSLITGSNYFLADGETVIASVIEGQLSELDVLTTGLEPEEVTEMRKELESNHGQGKPAMKSVLVRFAKKVSDAGKGTFKEFI